MTRKSFFAALALMIPALGLAGPGERRQAQELRDFQFVQVDKNSGGRVGGWLPGKIPGDVITDLFRAGKIKDPYVDFNSQDALWVNDWDWLYASEFDAELAAGERCWVLFHGVDYESEGLLNGVEIFRHTGMFSRILVEATALVKSAGRNRLEVKLLGQKNRPHLRNYQLDQFLEQLKRRKTTKTQMSYGWDIAVELIGAGIWDKAEIFKTGPVMIREIGVKTRNSGEVALDIDFDSSAAGKAIFKVTVSPENFGDKKPVLVKEFPVEPAAGKSSANLEFRIPNPKLWWSRDLGEPNLYRLSAELLVNGRPSDAVEETFGFREISWEQNPGAAKGWKWVCRLNGRRVFLRGANWVPPDAMPGRLSDEKYEQLIGLAAAANINLLRVWGGGMREREIFYELADRAGIMLWQEFPFACIYAPPYPRGKKFQALVEQEVSGIVRELRNHPSVILYSGGNEFVVSQNREIISLMRKVVSGLDPDERFIPASPAEGDSHNWVVWHQKGNLTDYFADEHALISEFGIQALPDVQTIEKYISPGLRWPLGEVYKHHNLEYGKIMKYISAAPHGESLESYVAASQEVQAYYYQRALEHWRIRKYRVSGALFWMFDEPWPGMVGSVVDYELRPKPAYERIKDSYSPLLIAADLEVRSWKPGDDFAADLFLVNDYQREIAGLKIEALLSGEKIAEWDADAEPDSSLKLARLEFKIPAGKKPVLELTVRNREGVIAHNLYELSLCDAKAAPRFNRALEKPAKRFLGSELQLSVDGIFLLE